MEDAELRIWLLGGFRAEHEARPVADEDWRRNRAKAVVKVLALAPHHRLHREQLTETLWPGLAPEAGDANLRKAVHFARRAIGPAWLKAAGELVGLEGAGLWIDSDAFEAAADSGDAQRAIDLYGGELLPEDRLEPWAEPHRERIQARLAQVLWQRAAELEGAADLSGAALQLERLLREDPYNEPAHLALMRLYARGGRRHRAVNLFQQLEKRLADDLGVEPESEARDLLEEILAGQVSARPPAATDARASALPSGERKIVTILAARLSAAGPENADLIEPLVESGAFVQASGESILATFGVPRVREDDQEQALLAGLEVVKRVNVGIHVGICSGRVHVERRADGYEIIGAAIDTATDLCRRATAGTVLVGGPVRRSPTWRFRFAEALRGRSPGSPAAPPRRLISVTPRARPRDRGEPDLVGRDTEIEVLTGLFQEVVESAAPRFILISGSPGIGKSRLLREAAIAIRARYPKLRVLRGRCLETGQGIVHSVLAEILRESCGVALDDSGSVVLAKFQDGLAEILEPLRLSAPDLATTVAALAATAAVTLPSSPLRAAEPRAMAEEQTRAWTRFASALGTTGPTLIMIEDLHWAAEQQLNSVERLIARSTGPLLVLATARPQFLEEQAAFGAGNERFSSISLRALTDRQSEVLGSSLQAGTGLWKRNRRYVLDRAEGNPYFLQELLRHLEERGAGGAADTSDPQPDLPDSLQVLLGARIDSLPAAAKRTLQEASVMGRVFWSGPLAASLGEAEVSNPLGELERRGFILGRPVSTLAGQEEFIFNHALLREVAYASLPRLRRVRAHSALGYWLEELAAQRREEVAELLAFHFTAALGAELDWDVAMREQIRQKAFGYLVLAGTLARKQDAGEKAIELHSSALKLALEPEERLEAVEELGDDHDSAFHGDAAVAIYEQGIDLARSKSAITARLCWKAARTMAMTPGSFGANPDPLRAEAFVAKGLSLAPDALTRARLLVARGAVARLFRGSEPFGQGESDDPVPIEERIAAVTEAMDLAQVGAEPELLASARSALGILYGVAGRYREMEQLARDELNEMDESLSSLEQADIIRRVAVNAVNVSAAFAEGLVLARRCHALCRDGNPHQVMHSTWPLLVALYNLGRWQEMWPILDEHLAAFGQDPAVQCQFVRDGPVIGAVLLLQTGNRERATELANLVGDPRRDPESVSAWQSRFAVVSGDPELALALSQPKVLEGRTYGPQHCVPVLEALIALEDWARLRAQLPRARAAASGNAILAPFADRAEGLCQLSAGAVGSALATLQRARDGFERLGALPNLEQVRREIGSLTP